MKLKAMRTAVLALLLTLGGSAAADNYEVPFDFEPVTDADWAMWADSSREDYDAVVLNEMVHVDDGVLKRISVKELTKKGCHRAIYRRIRILNEAGRSWGDVETPFFNLEQEQVLTKGRTILPDGTIIELQPENIFEKEVFKTKDEKYKQTTFSLPGVTDDCIIEYIIVTRAPVDFREWHLQKSVPVLNFSYRWVFLELNLTQDIIDFITDNPKYDFTIPNYLWLNSTTGQQVAQLPSPEEPRELLFTAKNLPAFESEPFSLPENSLKDRLLCYYGSKVPPMTYWGELSRSNGRTVNNFCEKDKEVEKLVEQFSGLASNEEKIKAAYEWIPANITNLSYFDLYDEKDSTKLKRVEDREYVDDVLKRGYGTIWQIQCLFWDMLQKMGIDAKYANSRDRFEDLFKMQAKYDQFDRSLICVPAGVIGYRFYAPGYYCTPCGMVPWWMEGTTALMSGADDYLLTVPFSSPTNNTAGVKSTMVLGDDLTVSGRVEGLLEGQFGRNYRYQIFDEKAPEHIELLTELIEPLYPEAELDSITYSGLDLSDDPFEIGFNLSFPAVSEVGGKILFKPGDYLSDADNPFATEERLSPVLFDFATDEAESVAFDLPEGWVVEAVPTDSTYRNKTGRCEIKFAVDESGRLTVNRTMMLKMPYWGVEDYPHIRRLFQAYEQMSAKIVVLNRQ